MAKKVVAEGVHTMVYAPIVEEVSPALALTEASEMEADFHKHGLSLTVVPTVVYSLTTKITEYYEKERLMTLQQDGKYVYTMLTEDVAPVAVEQLIYELQLKGLIPILVEPEKHPGVMMNPDWLYQLVKKGALVQLSAASVVSRQKISKFCTQLIDAHLVHFIASDRTNKNMQLRAAYDKVGQDQAMMFMENAERLLKDETIIRYAPERVKRKKFMWIL
nr:CpsB/CapC family capsule biosynthesis tyrosine phosphatase [Metabacillus iocasae]